MEVLLVDRIADVGGWSLFVLLLLVLFNMLRKGSLVPKSQVDSQRIDHDRVLSNQERVSEARIDESIEREKYARNTADTLVQANIELMSQNTKLTNELTVFGKTMSAIQPGDHNG